MNRVDDTLARVFAYDAVDLAANRTGQLSPDQRILWGNAARMARRRAPRIILFMLVVLGGLFTLLAMQGTVPKDQLAVAGAATMFMVAIISAISMLNYRQANKMEHMQVLVTEGLPVKSPASDGHWRLEVGGVRFAVMSGDIDYFHDTTVYRIYHAYIGVGSPAILSLEAVSPPKSAFRHC